MMLSALLHRKAAAIPTTILVVKLDEIGDMVKSLHVFSMLRNAFPQATINVLCKPVVQELLEAQSTIDCVLTSTEQLNSYYDCIVELRGTWRTLWFSITSVPKQRVDRGTIRYRNRGVLVTEEQTNAQIIAPLVANSNSEHPSIQTPRSSSEFVEDFLQQHSLPAFCIVHAGASKGDKHWGVSNYIQLIQWIYNTYALPTVVVGVQSEDEINQAILHTCSHTYRFPANATLTQFAALCHKARLFVGNDSGPMHVADTMNTPLVALFGPTPPIVFYPQSASSIVIHHVFPNQPLAQLPSMGTITIKEVQQAVMQLMDSTKNL